MEALKKPPSTSTLQHTTLTHSFFPSSRFPFQFNLAVLCVACQVSGQQDVQRTNRLHREDGGDCGGGGGERDTNGKGNQSRLYRVKKRPTFTNFPSKPRQSHEWHKVHKPNIPNLCYNKNKKRMLYKYSETASGLVFPSRVALESTAPHMQSNPAIT